MNLNQHKQVQRASPIHFLLKEHYRYMLIITTEELMSVVQTYINPFFHWRLIDTSTLSQNIHLWKLKDDQLLGIMHGISINNMKRNSFTDQDDTEKVNLILTIMILNVNNEVNKCNSMNMNITMIFIIWNTYRLFAFVTEAADKISWAHGKRGASLGQRGWGELRQLIKSSMKINFLQHPDKQK